MMYKIIDKICEQYNKIWDSRDTRLNHMPFMKSPVPMLMLIFIYLLFVRMSKIWMKYREPMQIDHIIVVYNFVQIIVNATLVVMITIYILFINPNFSFRCEPTNFSTDLMSMCIAYIGYGYFILKIIDYFDTIFFILRKKWVQVSFLHVYHHVVASTIAYIGVLYATGGQAIVFVYVNSFVHAVMYTYYLLSIRKPTGIRPSITFKKNVTRLQIIQFVIMVIHFGHVFVIPGQDCGYSKILSFLASTQNVVMIFLFSNFYRNAYGQKKEQEKIQ